MQPFLQWKNNECYTTCVCICNLRYAACNTHAPYLWPAALYNIFLHCLINGTIFEKKVIEHKMCVSSFSTSFVRNIFHSKKK
jgi:hypothetical protein